MGETEETVAFPGVSSSVVWFGA